MNPSSYHYNFTPSETIGHDTDHSIMITPTRNDEDRKHSQHVINLPIHQEDLSRSNFADDMAGTILSSVLSSVTDDITTRKNNRPEQKSLISVYDNSNDERTIGIIGHRSKRSIAFAKRLVSYGFTPVLTDAIGSTTSIESEITDNIRYVPNTTFRQSTQNTPIIIITEQPHGDIQYLTDGKLVIESIVPESNNRFLFNKKHLEQQSSLTKTFFINQSRTTSMVRAFGNLSAWEIEHDTTQRVPVYIQQHFDISPTTIPRLLKFIHELHFHDTRVMNEYDYNNVLKKRTFQGCLFPLLTTLLVFIVALLVAIIRCSGYEETRDFSYCSNNHSSIFRRASSVTGATSLILLVILYLIRPILELIDFLSYHLHAKSNKTITTKQNNQLTTILKGFNYFNFVQRWLHSRRYLTWYSVTFALLHILFLTFSQEQFSLNRWQLSSFFIGIITLILLIILTIVYLPWINERLLSNEWRIIVSYVGSLTLLLGFIHVLLLLVKQWNSYESLFNLTFISLLLSLCVVIVRLIVYAIIYPLLKTIDWLKRRRNKNSVKKNEQITESGQQPPPHVIVTTSREHPINTNTATPLLKKTNE
ncbi:unnamed protein product [Didymodactylos carnosus]|uniref:Uncharacterized protein n=1 Tax=Didymodactylos carnosus TaxID=1234261 RepID=A0A814UPL1_9BILA|nr:unnamed protein product [Didymodactylos carnosus]CAF1180149.1 unnamed protein product [Didymodactylos carnosus]CAF3672613.1 unnamed protein product [Didymodactylos carnosus]CAF3944471.1 unnamed protein product [Didymodactylos carnosus]